MIHKPVLLNEVLESLNPQADQNVIDGTVGQGGHAKYLLEKIGPSGILMGIDLDPNQIANCRKELAEFGDRLLLVNDSYANVAEIVKANHVGKISGMLLDLGFSSWQIQDSSRGFTFQKDEPLDMRFNTEANELTAEIIVNEWSEGEIEKILEQYGEEDFAKRIARNICEERKVGRIKSTFELAEVIKNATPSSYWRGRIHYATRTFQALRIAVNGELESIEKGLKGSIEILEPGGRLAVISFHSLEDRIVKQYFREQESENRVKNLYKKPLEASQEEKDENPRSRSAKLRVIIKL